MAEPELLTIIIPIYNAAQHLEECLESVCAQTYRHLQIILVDNNSTDKSAEICKRFAKQDSRILYLFEEQKGVSFARNKGLSHTMGQYICFVDADDLLPPDALEKRMALRNEADLIVTGYVQFCELEADLITGFHASDTRCSNRDMIRYTLQNAAFGYQGYLWNKLFRANIIQKHQIRFQTGIYYNEDRLFLIAYLRYAKNAYITEAITYQYRMNETGAMSKLVHLSEGDIPRVMTEIYAFQAIKEMLQEDGDTENYGFSCKKMMEKSVCLYRCLPKSDKKYHKELYKIAWENYRNALKLRKTNVKDFAHCFLMR